MTRRGKLAHDMPVPEELELPPLDGASEEVDPSAEDDLSMGDDANPYDDATGDDDDFVEKLDTSHEPSALGDDAAGLMGGEGDALEDAPGETMIGDEDAPGVAGEDFGLIDTGDSVRDGGEEGLGTPEPELRVEDLPRLDEGGDDDLSIEDGNDVVVASNDLRWDDRGFERAVARPIGHVTRIRLRGGIEVALEDGSVLRSVDGGATFFSADHVSEDDEAILTRGRARALLREGVGVLRAIDDGPLTLVEATAAATAFTLLDDGSLIAAIDGPERSRLVCVGVDGIATVVAEEESPIEALAAEPRTGLVWAGGAFGLIAFRRA